MVDLPRVFRNAISGPNADGAREDMSCVGVVQGVMPGPGRLASLAALFPQVKFESVGETWPLETPANIDTLLVSLSATSSESVECAIRRLKARRDGLRIVIALYDADVMTTRRLLREGATDVLPAPVSEPSLAACLDRLMATTERPVAKGRTGEVVVALKAGGGVGATSLSVQLAALMSGGGDDVCLVDLDLQFGAVALYLDLPDAITIADCLASGSLEETPYQTALATHRSGARVLASPREMVPLETLGPPQAAALIRGLRRNFGLTIVDLPQVWTAWTNEVLHHADRILLVTHLSAPHVQMVKRQLRMLTTQGLDGKPLTIVCNAPSADQASIVSIKAAERALGRPFDVVVPEDRRTMMAATNQGVEISAVRRGTKLERAIAELAAKVSAQLPLPAGKRK
jgi:pilus assembly protein CpaE